MSDPALDVSDVAEGERATAGEVGVMDAGNEDWSSTDDLWRAITSSTRPRACCRMLMACRCDMSASRGCPSIARIWSPSWRRPSLQNTKEIPSSEDAINQRGKVIHGEAISLYIGVLIGKYWIKFSVFDILFFVSIFCIFFLFGVETKMYFSQVSLIHGFAKYNYDIKGNYFFYRHHFYSKHFL